MWATIKTKHLLDAHDVGPSTKCSIALTRSSFGATFESYYMVFQNSVPILTLKVGLKARKLIAMRLG